MHWVLFIAFLLQLLWAWGALWLGWNGLGRPGTYVLQKTGTIFGACLLIGWFIQSLIILACGLAGWLSPYTLSLIIFLPLGLIILDRKVFLPWFSAGVKEALKPFHRGFLFHVINLFLFFGLLVISLTPAFFFDTLHYHFGQPLSWLIQSQIVPFKPDVFSYIPMPERMHNLLGLGLLGEPMTAIGQLFHLIFAAFVLGNILYHAFNLKPPWPALGALGLFTLPALWETLLYHLPESTIVWASIVFVEQLLLSGEKRLNPAIIPLAGALNSGPPLTTGILACFKTAVIAPYAFICYFVHVIHSFISKPSHTRIFLIGQGLLAFVPLLPWFFFSYHFSGSILTAGFPYLSFKDIETTRWHHHLYVEPLHISTRQEPLPIDLIRSIRRFYSPESPRIAIGGRPGLVLLLLLPASFLIPSGNRSERMVRLMFGAALIVWLFTYRLPRYAVFILPLAILLTMSLLSKITRPKTVLMFITLILPFHTLYFYHSRTLQNAVGLSLHQFFGKPLLSYKRARVIPASVDVCRYANQNLNPRHHRLLFIGEYRYYPCHIPFIFHSPLFRHPFERLRHTEPPEKTWLQYLKKNRITHIIYSPDEVKRLFEISPRLQKRLDQFLRRVGYPLTAATGPAGLTFLLELNPEPNRVRSRSNKPVPASPVPVP